MKLATYIAVLGAVFGLSMDAAAQDTEQPATQTASYGGERYEIDHIFFFSEGFAPELSYLEQQGFLRWPFDTSHNGQGTTGRYVYFDNFYIEFLWVDDADAASANTDGTVTNFNDRNRWSSDASVSPFGIGLRDNQEGTPRGFETSEYSAEWMGGEFVLSPTGSAQDLAEPWSFFMPRDMLSNPRDSFGGRSASRLEHSSGARLLTGMTLVLPAGQQPSSTLQALAADGLVSIIEGEEHRIELTLDYGEQGITTDLRERGIPIVFHY
jgi:hypothetical protein